MASLNPETGTVYSRAQLSAAFDRVKHPTNWKFPVRCTIPEQGADLAMIHEAVIFFTGSVPKFLHFRGKVLVRSAGYYVAVGA